MAEIHRIEKWRHFTGNPQDYADVYLVGRSIFRQTEQLNQNDASERSDEMEECEYYSWYRISHRVGKRYKQCIGV